MIRFVPALLLFALPLAAVDMPEVRTLTVSPAVATRSALAYEFLPRLRDSQPGNRALEYARGFHLRPTATGANKEAEGELIKQDGWLQLPLDQLPLAEAKEALKPAASMLRTLDSAARYARYETEQWSKIREEGVNLLLPDAQLHRDAARLLALRCRIEMAERRYDDAKRTLQTMFRMAKDVGESPSLIQMLVGLAITNIALSQVEQWIQLPGSQNLYWALTALPQPFIDPRPGLEGEAIFFDSFFPRLKDFEGAPMTAERANESLLGIFVDASKATEGLPKEDRMSLAAGPLTAVALGAYLLVEFEGAKAWLLADGMDPATLAKMPPAQVVALKSIRLVRRVSDDSRRAFFLPYSRGGAESLRVDQEIKALRANHGRDLLLQLAIMVLPAMQKVHESLGRTERRIAALRVIEAIRLHAAANAGTPPKSLADITAMYVPDDPVTGKPFEYSTDGKSFTLVGPQPAGTKPDVRNSVKYDVTVR